MSDATVTDIAVDQRAMKGSSSSILGMTLFVASEAMFFAAFFGAYFTIYAATAIWPPLQIPIPEVSISAIATVLLITSGFMARANLGDDSVFRRGIREYMRRDFHPSQSDTDRLAADYLESVGLT